MSRPARGPRAAGSRSASRWRRQRRVGRRAGGRCRSPRGCRLLAVALGDAGRSPRSGAAAARGRRGLGRRRCWRCASCSGRRRPPRRRSPTDRGPWPRRRRVGRVAARRRPGRAARLLVSPATGPGRGDAAGLPGGARRGVVEVGGPAPTPARRRPVRRRTCGGPGAAGSLEARRLSILDTAGGCHPPGRRGTRPAMRCGSRCPSPRRGSPPGILVGLRERVDRDLAADFATAGASHVVAISGWNIAIVGGARRRPRSAGGRAGSSTVVVLGTIVAYVVAAGASPSVVRAAVMAGVVLLARESGRAGRARRGARRRRRRCCCSSSPAMIGDAGFRLSVAGDRRAARLGERRSVGWLGGLGGGRMPGWLAESLGISLAAQAATLPDVLVTFGRLSLVVAGREPAVVPLVPGRDGGRRAGDGSAGRSRCSGAPAVVATLARPAGWLAAARHRRDRPHRGARCRSRRSRSRRRSPRSPALVAGGAVAGGPGAASRPGRDGRRRSRAGTAPRRRPCRTGAQPHERRPAIAPGRVAVAVAGARRRARRSPRSATRPAAATRLTVLDVGQGDAILLETRTGARMLVDGGPDPDRLLVALDERIPPWDRRLDVVVLTHPHEDHVAGLAADPRAVPRRARVRARACAGRVRAGAAWDAVLRDGAAARGTLADRRAAAARRGLAARSCGRTRAGPARARRTPGPAINNVSIVLLGEAERAAVPADGRRRGGRRPGAPRRAACRASTCSRSPTTAARRRPTQAFLDAVRPRVAVASAGAGNTYGHPAPATLARLRERGADVYRTDRDGSVDGRAGSGRPDRPRDRARAASPSTTAAPCRRRVAAIGAAGRSVRDPDPGRVAAGPDAPRDPRRSPSPAGRVDRRPADWAVPAGYDPSHDDPRSPRGRPPAALARCRRRGSCGTPAPSRTSRRGSRAGPQPGGTPSTARGRDGGAAARRRQAAGAPDARRTSPWRRVGGLARGPRATRSSAPVVRDHPVTRLAEPGFDALGSPTASLEARIVAYADKRAAQRLESMDARFASWRRRYPPGWDKRVRRTGGSVWSEETVDLASGTRAARAGGLRGGRRRPRDVRPPALVARRALRRGRRDERRRPGPRLLPRRRRLRARPRGRDRSPADRAGHRRAARTAGGCPVPRRTPPTSASASRRPRCSAAGRVAVVVDPAPLLRSKAEREALEGAIADRRPGQRPRVPRAGRRRRTRGRPRCRASRRRS